MDASQLSELLEQAAKLDRSAVDVACELYDASAVELLPKASGSGYDFAFHLVRRGSRRSNHNLLREHCALLNPDLLPLSNGVVMGPEHGDLRCSFHPCHYKMCPVAMAAGFLRYSELGGRAFGDRAVRLPVYDEVREQRLEVEREVESFRDRWVPRLEDSDFALNLLLDTRENDFSGLLVDDDDSWRDAFIDDVFNLLVSMGKVDSDSLVRVHLMTLIENVDPARATFLGRGNNENLAPRKLYVIDRVADASGELGPRFEMMRNFVLERLSHIVDDRYVILAGTSRDLERLLDKDSRLTLAFDQHRINLKAMPEKQLYGLFLEDLSPRLRADALSNPDFEREFTSFVAFNRDCIPFKGEELADYLAKNANAHGKLTLPTSRYKSSSLTEMLEGIVGLESVKDTLRSLESYALFRKREASRGRTLPPANLHMVFLGNPGTGKTMVARIVAAMLYKIGITRRNSCVEVTSKDLIAGYVGQTDKRTADVVSEALGGVLFIDEAYALASGGEDATGDFGRESIAQLVKEMEDHKDDLIVIFAGYEREMSDFVELNPGLASRIGYTFTFRDYSVDELFEMFRRKVTAAGFEMAEDGLEADLRETLAYFSRFRSFGNGRFVEEVFQKTIVHHAERTARGAESGLTPGSPLTREDLPSRSELFGSTPSEKSDTKAELEALVGLEDLKTRVFEFERTVAFREEAARRGLRLPITSYSMTLTGNPGTGKTTVARIIAGILHSQGAVPTDRFVEVEARDLSAFQFRAGRSPLQRHIDEAMGGVLFIDEAYALLETNGGSEVIAALVKAMEDHKGELVVMLAGYGEPMRRLLDSNPGLSSRIGYTFAFEDYSTEELLEIFRRKVDASGLVLEGRAEEVAWDVVRYFHSVENFGNGRFVDRLFQEAVSRHANRIGDGECSEEGFRTLEEADIPDIKTMCRLTAVPVFDPGDVSGDEDRRRVALHEIGHALCRLVTTGKSDIVTITIEQEGNGALGYVQHKTIRTALPTSHDLEDEITVFMAGMAAEELAYGAYSAGNSSDLREATRLTLDYVARYGMSEAGFFQYLGSRETMDNGLWELPEKVTDSVNAVMARCFATAKDIIDEHKATYSTLVERLLETGTMDGDDIESLWEELECGDSKLMDTEGGGLHG